MTKGMSYKWIVAIVVVFGIFMSILDTTIVNNAISRLQTAFGASLSDVDWVSTGYTLTEGVSTPLSPFFQSLLGTKRFYLFVLVFFTLGSALCGLAWSLPALIAFRIMQGLGGACMLPLSISMLYTEFPPEERGTAMGALGIPILLAPALGPTVGGYIVTYYGWQLIFYINLPIGIVGFFMALFLLRNSEPQRGARFDLPGFIFSTVGLVSLLYALDDAGTDGWGSAKVINFLILGLVSLVIFVVIELLTIQSGKQPLLDLRVFRILSFAGGSVGTVMITIALYGGLYLVPIYLQGLRGLSAYQSGIELLPQAFASMVAVVIAGRLADKLGVKPVAIPGLLILGFALWSMSHLATDTPYSTIQVLLVMRGFGLGLCMQTTSQAALSAIRGKEVAQASSINSLLRSVASAMGVATMTTLVSNRRDFHYVRLAEQVTTTSASGKVLLAEIQSYVAQGMSLAKATGLAVYETYEKVYAQAYMLAINDAFVITVGFIAVAILVVLFILPNRPPASKPAASSGEKVGEAQEEKEMVFAH
jgi:DHA2 family multidrug resistance protein